MQEILVRQEQQRDFPEIDLVNTLAFGQDVEAILVRKLRASPGYMSRLSLVASAEEKVIGHILFTPVTIRGGGKIYQSLTLAPMSVLPEFQNQGIGTKLVTSGIEIARALGFTNVNVLGHPEYYPRFGFEPASKWEIRCPFDVPDEAFMMMELVEDALKGIKGTLIYPDCMLDAA